MKAINHVAVWVAGIVQFLLGAVLGLALVGTTLAQNYAFEARSASLWLINAGYMVVGMTIMGAIVGHWKKKA